MGDHATARAEVERIDFLLDELARAVERGEVHRTSYDLMAPRYLARRAELVAAITGRPQSPPLVDEYETPLAVVPQGGTGFSPRQDAAVAPRHVQPSATPRPAPVAQTSRPRREPKPVDWTTVLLFLGAFLVIVASAVFSVAVWGLLDTFAKFGFLGALTVGFYAAGWWARSKLKLSVGSTALTVVASSMLLFDGWILIDGYGLTGPWPWAALLLVCSLVYWYTETRIASGFFGVIGAGAQIAWWWLLGSGLGLPTPVRIAGIAIVALAWQLAGERGRDRTGVGSLARILEWAAPVVAAGSTAAILADLALLTSADVRAVVSAGVVSATAGVVAWRALSRRPRELGARAIVATLVQLPVFLAAVLAALDGHAWWIVAVFLGAAVAYDLLGLTGRGTPFVIAGLLAEFCAVVEAAFVLDASAVTTTVVVAALGSVWALSARLLDRLAADEPSREHHARAAVACEVGAFVLLVGASAALPGVTLASPVPDAVLSRADVLGYVGVLAAWWAAATIRPRGVTAFAGSLFSFATLAAVEVWAWPDATAALFALPHVALAGVWLASGRVLQPRYGEPWGAVTRWSARAALVLFALAPVAIAPFVAGAPKTVGPLGAAWDPVLLLLAAAGIAVADAVVERTRPSAAFSSTAAVLAAWVAADAIADRAGAVRTGDLQSLAVALVAAAIGAAAWWLLRTRHEPLSPWFSVGAAAAASPLVVAAFDMRSSVAVAIAAVVLAGAWGVAAACSSQSVAVATGLALVGAVGALVPDAGQWLRVLAFGGLGLALATVPFVPPFDRSGRAADAGTSLALAGLAGYLAAIASTDLVSQAGVAALLVTAVGIAATSAARSFEPGYHLAGLVLVLAVWSEISVVGEYGAPAALYALPLAVYLAGTGYLHVRLGKDRRYPEALDAFAVIVGVGYPLLIALQAGPDRALADSLAAVVMALVAIGAGVVLRVRWYFFGGVAGLALVAFYRSFSAIAEYWWLVLGLVGIAMLVIALTWQRQRIVVAEARASLKRSFERWR